MMILTRNVSIFEGEGCELLAILTIASGRQYPDTNEGCLASCWRRWVGLEI